MLSWLLNEFDTLVILFGICTHYKTLKANYKLFKGERYGDSAWLCDWLFTACYNIVYIILYKLWHEIVAPWSGKTIQQHFGDTAIYQWYRLSYTDCI